MTEKKYQNNHSKVSNAPWGSPQWEDEIWDEALYRAVVLGDRGPCASPNKSSTNAKVPDNKKGKSNKRSSKKMGLKHFRYVPGLADKLGLKKGSSMVTIVPSSFFRRKKRGGEKMQLCLNNGKIIEEKNIMSKQEKKNRESKLTQWDLDKACQEGTEDGIIKGLERLLREKEGKEKKGEELGLKKS